MNKHAYLIMAHHREDLIHLLLNAIDDERNDIYIHLDKKSNLNKSMFSTKMSKLIFIKPMIVNWAGYTQVECEFILLENSVSNGPYQYYHFLTGATFPLKNQDDMHRFFDIYNGKEFVGFDNNSDFSDRVRYRYLFCEDGKLNGPMGRLKSYIRNTYLLIQKVISYDRIKRFNVEIKKGMAYWSITEKFASYILSQESFVKEMLWYSISGDEIFVQTIAYNSNFKDRIFDINDEFRGASREFAWSSCVSGNHYFCNWDLADFKYLSESQKCFALKFESDEGIEILNKLKKAKNIN